MKAAARAQAITHGPHSEQAEQAVLAACTLDPEAVDEVAEVVGVEDWYVERHRVVWEAMLAIRHAGRTPDTVTLREHLASSGRLGRVGGDMGLVELTGALPPPNLRSHAEIVRDKARVRRMVHECDQVSARGRGHVTDAQTFLDEAEARIFRAAEARHDGGPVAIREVVIERFSEIEAMGRRGDTVPGLPTGFPRLDTMLAGLKPDELIIVAGRPGMGKSAFAGSIVESACLRGETALVFSLEMGRKQWVDRALAAEARVDGKRIRTGQLEEDDWPRLSIAANTISSWPLFIDDTPAVSLMAVRSRARRIRRRHGLAVLVVDYIQLMRSGFRHGSREEEVAEISRGLKALSKELEVPVVALAQLNRKVEERRDRRPNLGDLRESGQLEQDADAVMFLYREEVYEPKKAEVRGLGEIIVSKQRMGPTGVVKARWDAGRTRFYPLAADDSRGGGVDWQARATAAAQGHDPEEFRD